MNIRPTRVEIDLDALAHNFDLMRTLARGRKICGVVKADAYGHGAVPVGKTLAECGADWLAVALVEEGVTLRNAGIETPILVLGGALDGGYQALREHRLTPMICSDRHVDELARVAEGQPLDVHLKIDTGMSRLGVPPDAVGPFLTRLRDTGSIVLDGVMTHFANADDGDTAANERQAQLFRAALEQVRAAGFEPPHIHASNSAATSGFDERDSNLVRPGLLLYGVNPLMASDARLRPVMRWTTSPVHVKSIPAGTRVSYGGIWEAKRESVVATLPVGYADGYPRALSNKAHVLVNGKPAPVVGRVCMDLCIVDVTDCGVVRVGDEVVLLGEQKGAKIDAEELARLADTIPYEIFTGVQRRVQRIFRR